MMKYVELLSGAGNFNTAKIAFNAGCDAVYVGLKNFNARRMTDNFSFDELKQLINLANKLNKKVYITVNTLIKDNEIKDFLNSIYEALNLGTNAFIMQDLGMIKLVSEIFPNIKIHLSTQANIHNLYSLKLLSEKIPQIERAILSRECELNEIKNICQNLNIQIEVFVFGALCSAVSGICYMSSFNNNRSGNRGVCSQMCRLKYNYDNNLKYFLSTMDLCTLKYISQLYNAGVSAFKIEGRNRSETYVYNITSIFRYAIDLMYENKLTPNIIDELMQKASLTYNRKLTFGYLLGRKNAKIIFCERNTNEGLLISNKIFNFDLKNKIIKFKTNYELNKADILELEDDKFQRIPIKIIKILDKNNNLKYDILKNEIITIYFKLINKEDDLKIQNFNIKNIFIIHPQSIAPINKKNNLAETQVLNNKNIDNKFELNITIEINRNCGINCKIKYLNKEFFYNKQIKIQDAHKNPITINDITKTFLQFNKTKFNLKQENFTCNIDNDIFIPLSILKSVGKTIFEEFENDFNSYYFNEYFKILDKIKFIQLENDFKKENNYLNNISDLNLRLSLFNDYNVETNLFHSFNEITYNYYFLLKLYENQKLNLFLKNYNNFLNRCLIELPPITFENDIFTLKNIISMCLNHNIKGVIVNNLSQIYMLNNFFKDNINYKKIIIGNMLNPLNLFTINFFNEFKNISEIYISFELNHNEIISLLKHLEKFNSKLLEKICIKIFGYINTATFAYDFFKQNQKYIKNATIIKNNDLEYKICKLFFENAFHHILNINDEITLAYSGTYLNMLPFLDEYLNFNIKNFEFSLFNFSDKFKDDLNLIEQLIKNKLQPKHFNNYGIIKDKILI